jgi:hypothetical protein
MKKNFTQAFEKSRTSTATILVEVSGGNFLQFTAKDELDAFYADTLTFELDYHKDVTLQLAEMLHNNGLELMSYRELARENLASFSYADDTPGKVQEIVCIYVLAERTSQAVPHAPDRTVEFVALEEYMQNLRDTGMPTGLLELGVCRLLLERSVI